MARGQTGPTRGSWGDATCPAPGGRRGGAGSLVPTEKTRPGTTRVSRGEAGTRARGAACAGRLAPLPPPPRIPDPAARVLTGSRRPRGRAAGRRGAEAHSRLPGGSGFCAAPRPELLSRTGRRPPPAPRTFAYSAARLPPWPARGPSPGCGCRASGRRAGPGSSPPRGMGAGGILGSIRRGGRVSSPRRCRGTGRERPRGAG